MIRVEELKKNYGSVKALSRVSFSIERGEIVGFLGPNGAGKTTTMKILTGYLLPDQGIAEVAGFNVVDHPIEAKVRTGYLPESTPLYGDMWVKDYLDFVAGVRLLQGENKKRGMDRVVDVCGLGAVLYKSIHELSKGFRQRVGIAQAMIHDPEVLILDEPTVGLDPNQIAEIRQLIKQLGREKTVILSTHVMQEVQATCTRALIINQGTVIKDAPVQELTKGDNTVYLTWRAPEAKGLAALKQKFQKVEVLDQKNDGGKVSLKLRLDGGEDCCEDIFSIAATNQWKISKLQGESATLEEVFQKLTAEGRS